MRPSEKADLILHPVRLQILQTLAGRKLTTAQIAAEMAGTPVSSIYRHLKRLLDGGLVQVAESTPIRGVEEKVYSLTQPARISQEDIAGMSQEEHIHSFARYLATLLDGFADYIQSPEQHDYMADRVGYTEIQFYASAEEMDTLGRLISEKLLEMSTLTATAGRVKRKFSVISHPLVNPSGANDQSSDNGSK